MLKLFSEKKRWGLVFAQDRYGQVRKRYEIGVHRSRADGSTISVSYPANKPGGRQYLTLNTEELILAIMHATNTDEQLQERWKKLNG